MGQNHKVVTKRRRRESYLKRKKAEALQKSLIAKSRVKTLKKPAAAEAVTA
jgi:hypothetical protein